MFKMENENKLIIIFSATMIKIQTIIVLLLMLGLASALTGIGLNPIRPLKLNKGKSTKYMFFINPQT